MKTEPTTTQQKETQEYFRRVADEWRQKAEGALPATVNVIEQRNGYVLDVAKAKGAVRHSLDVGCGTGELVCDLGRLGAHAVGVDFAAEMVELARKKASAQSLTSTEFHHASIFDYRPADVQFDLVSANGFIEYISEAQLVEFLAHARSMLSANGSLVIGSRNRLFNAFTLNQYTQLEIECGAAPLLLHEAMILANEGSLAAVVDRLSKAAEPLPQILTQPSTEIDVAVRLQYTPGELIRIFRSAGFACVGLSPVHYHGAVPRFADQHPEVHAAVSDLMHKFAPAGHYLIPSASTFMVHAERMA